MPGLFRKLVLNHFSKPICDRPLYRAVQQFHPRHILELGVGSAQRSLRLVELALAHVPADELRYTGVDLFESRPAGRPGLTLREAHRLLRQKLAKVQLLPGDPWTALARAANALQGVDLVIVSADQQGETLDRAWFYLPRTLAAAARVYVQTGQGDAAATHELTRAQVDALAAVRPQRRAA